MRRRQTTKRRNVHPRGRRPAWVDPVIHDTLTNPTLITCGRCGGHAIITPGARGTCVCLTGCSGDLGALCGLSISGSPNVPAGAT